MARAARARAPTRATTRASTPPRRRDRRPADSRPPRRRRLMATMAEGTARAMAAAARPRTRPASSSPATSRPRAPRGPGAVALGGLCVVYVLLAALPAAPGSKLVLGTAGGSPGWLLGPLRFAGIGAARGTLAGPLFYAGLWLALILYAVTLARLRDLPAR